MRLYIRVHSLRGVAIGLAAAAIVDLTLGGRMMPMPGAHGAISLPFRHELPIAYASICVGSLRSAMRSAEATAANGLSRIDLIYVSATIAAALAIGAPISYLHGSRGEAGVFVCGIGVWAGLAMLSGRMFGWGMAWILPMTTVFPLVYYSLDRSDAIRWWAWTAQPSPFAGAWCLAAGCLTLGVAAMIATPWRIRHARTIVRALAAR